MTKQIKNNIHWVGYVDDREVPFHRLVLAKGTTYNSYLIKSEKPTLIDTVDISFGKQFVETVAAEIDLAEIAYVVINHVEPDHSGGLVALLNKAPNAVVVTTALGAEELRAMYKLDHQEFLIVKDGDNLDIGDKTLRFLETPYLHTAETMVTYCEEDKILFPCDQFSSHVATSELFNDKASEDFFADFKVYYELIMQPHRPYVQDMLEKIKDLDIEMIAPSHGFVLRENVGKYIDAYHKWSTPHRDQKKAVLVYSSMTGNTRVVADELAQGLTDRDVEVELINLKQSTVSEALEKIKSADAILLGSSTRYADIVGDLEELLKRLSEFELGGKLGVAFGSYGWSGEAIEVVQDYLRQTDLTVVDSAYVIKHTGMDHLSFPVRVKFNPQKTNNAQQVRESGNLIGDLLVS